MNHIVINFLIFELHINIYFDKKPFLSYNIIMYIFFFISFISLTFISLMWNKNISFPQHNQFCSFWNNVLLFSNVFVWLGENHHKVFTYINLATHITSKKLFFSLLLFLNSSKCLSVNRNIFFQLNTLGLPIEPFF